MIERHVSVIAAELELPEKRVRAAAALLGDDATIPFIARYRKEATGSLDEVSLTRIRDRLRQLANLDARRRTILASLEKHGHLTPDLATQIKAAPTLSVLEDLYLPRRPKRGTRASIAKTRGLEPLAQLILDQQPGVDPYKAARKLVNRRAGVPNAVAALQGARDIIAERIAEDPAARAAMRDLSPREALSVPPCARVSSAPALSSSATSPGPPPSPPSPPTPSLPSSAAPPPASSPSPSVLPTVPPSPAFAHSS